jgi:DNA-binding NarL/FixJ family response regulator
MTGGNLVRVMIVDDHQVVRSGIRFSLLAFDDLELVAEAESGEEALRWCSQASGSAVMPDVILMDMLMPGMDGVATTRAVLEQFPEIQVIALTSFETGTCCTRRSSDSGRGSGPGPGRNDPGTARARSQPDR